jgi:hypothetical protein
MAWSSFQGARGKRLRNVRFGLISGHTDKSAPVRFTPNSGRWTAHPSQHFGCAFISALVDAGEETGVLRKCRDDDGRMEHKERYARLPMLMGARTVVS